MPLAKHRLSLSRPRRSTQDWRLRYRVYLDAGLIEPSESGMVSDQYEDAPNAWTFGIHGAY
ncbi:N-acyl amino acid synthase FeeM domain-containing protein [Bradyrhizobium sp. BR 1432]|uniref:N-acyl amino acid synthase FeeM domain-containing protein n=1 Tax=Bradyrhizobium sp. BR 1432 TaxID=3447966 RepID=UPI003EE7D5CD